MIDFNTTFTKMGDMGHGEANTLLDGLLLDGETVHAAFTGTRGWVAFTDRRLIIVTAQGLTGKKKDYTTLPYSGIRAASVDTIDGFETDAIWNCGSAIWDSAAWSEQPRHARSDLNS